MSKDNYDFNDLDAILAEFRDADAPPAARCRLAAEIIGNLLHEPKPTESALYEAYRSRLMLGREVTVADGDRQYRVMTEDIDTEGHLLVRMTDGSLRALSAEEIRILP
jgi:biotin-(acetyl-CoA carboxylase) ligase